ncbi:MAG: ABC-F family ATP-binding cassette domain-containing protein [Campylobacterales bacterium]|nr:ABC-F family ATP-binding cassette domain-containing protein [Campylobacterales bacterium]
MIQISNLSKNFGQRELFSNLGFTLGRGYKVGLVGRNGTGKSTLFKMILGEESPDGGEIIIPKGYRIGALKQYLKFDHPTVLDEAASALSEEMQYETYRAEKMLFGLGFSYEDLYRAPSEFSGGYQIRINLAKLLLSEPSLLLLDEPTNYLDIISLRWLKGFLRSFQGEVILITHDRDFMDAVSTHTMGIVRRGLFWIEGDTEKFYSQLAQNEELYEKEKVSQDKKRKELEDFIARNGARASTAAQAQSKAKQLEKMGSMHHLAHDASLDFDFNYRDTPAKVLLEAKGLSFGYNPEVPLFSDVSFVLERGRRLAIIGKNGSGKSTLLNTIAGELKAQHGEVAMHPSTAFGHFGQTNINRLSPDHTVMEAVYVADPKLAESTVRGLCGAMLFSGDAAKKKVNLLSGGEKSRVMLAQILARPSNLLFLDEPTHHLDMDSIEALMEAIERFKGSVIIVTHAEEVLRRVADALIVFDRNGAFFFDGSYDDFLEKIGWDDEEEAKPKSKSKNSKKESKKQRSELIAERSKATKGLKEEVEELEKAIMKAETALKALHVSLEQATKKGDSPEVAHLSKAIAQEEKAVEARFEQLEKVQSTLDAVMAEFEAKLSGLEA